MHQHDGDTWDWIEDLIGDDLDAIDEALNTQSGFDPLAWIDDLAAEGTIPQAGYGTWHDDDGGTAQSDAEYFMDATSRHDSRPSLN